MMTTRLRLAARVALPLGLIGAVIGAGAAPAFASAPTVTVAGSSPVTANTTVSATATDSSTGALGPSHTLTLTVTSPDGHTQSWSQTFSNTQNGKLTGQVNTACPAWSASPCVQAANGTYTFTAKSGSTSSSPASVTLAVPPSDVKGFSGSASGSVASFSWAANTDNVPDFAGYQISDGSSSVTVAPNSGACDASSCGVSIDYGAAARGQTYSFSIVALRSKAPGSSGTVPSADPATTSVSFPAPPSPAPSSGGSGSTGGSGSSSGSGGGSTTGSGSGGGTTSGDTTGGGTTTGGSTQAGGARGPVLTGKNPGADLGRYLPTVSAGAAPNLPAVITEIKPIPQGTYKPTLAYPDQTQTSSSTKAVPGNSIDAVGNDIVKVLNLRTLWTSLAAAALLLLVAAHLRAWLDGIDTAD